MDKPAENVDETDIKKIAGIIKCIENQRNGKRNKTIFLILLCFGMERRKICALTWNDIDKKCEKIKMGKHEMVMPHILQQSFKELKQEKNDDATYVFGNSRTNWQNRYRKVELMGFWNLSKILIHKMSSIKNFRRGIYENGFLDFYLKKIRYRMC